MTNQIVAPPNKYNFGLDFNYSLWTKDTVIDLVNVPWNNDYRDIVSFDESDENQNIDAYIDSLEPGSVRIDKMSYVKPNEPVRVNIPINRAIKYNYLRASNPLQPVTPADEVKRYYYFITDVKYVSPNTTELTLQLDVWTTFCNSVDFGTAYVERGHVGIANENNFDNYGRDYLTVPEGFDLGNEYRVIATSRQQVMGAMDWRGNAGQMSHIVVFSTIALNGNYGTASDPRFDSAEGSLIDGVPSGASAYFFRTMAAFRNWLLTVKDKPWITQGIVSITMLPFLDRYSNAYSTREFSGLGPAHLSDFRTVPRRATLRSNWRNHADITNNIPSRYSHLKKFFTYPYMGIELTTWTATPVTLKPEVWANPHAEVMDRLTIMPPYERLEVFPRRYNSDGRTPLGFQNMTEGQIASAISAMESEATVQGMTFYEAYGTEPTTYAERLRETGDDFGDYLDIQTQIANFPKGAIVNNAGVAYLAANAHSINYQRESANWSQQRALEAASVGYDQASVGMDTSARLNTIGIDADMATTRVRNETQAGQAIAGTVGGVIGGSVAGGASAGGVGAGAGAMVSGINAATNLINAGIQIGANTENLAIRTTAAQQGLGATLNQQGFIRDTNKNLADWAARGDYANTILGVNAKVQDAAMLQPTVSGQHGGNASNITQGTMEIALRWKMVDSATVKRIGEYWLRYGYAVNLPMTTLPPKMHCMTKFTYWKLSETYMQSSAMPEAFKQTIRGIFEKGVTVWRRPEYIGNTDFADNQAIAGITL